MWSLLPGPGDGRGTVLRLSDDVCGGDRMGRRAGRDGVRRVRLLPFAWTCLGNPLVARSPAHVRASCSVTGPCRFVRRLGGFDTQACEMASWGCRGERRCQGTYPRNSGER